VTKNEKMLSHPYWQC